MNGVYVVNCFVTGGTGFVGSHLMRLLTNKGHEVKALVRKTSDTSLIDGLPYKAVVGDVRDKDSFLQGAQDCEWFFHNAAIMSDWGGKPHFYPVNVEGTRNVLEVVRKNDISRLIHTSSTAVYGLQNSIKPLQEDSPKRPFGAYQQSKLAAEDLIRQYMTDYGIKATMVRPPTILGKGDMYTGPLLIQYLKSGQMMYFGDGSNLHSVVHGEDAARCLVTAAERFDKAAGNAYNVTSFTVEWRVLIEAIAQELNEPLKVRKFPYRIAYGLGALLGGLYRAFLRTDPPVLTTFRVKVFGSHLSIDDSKARTELGYEPSWDLESTAKDVVEWGGKIKPR